MIKNITINKLKELVGTVNIIDIRSREDYELGHIDSSINISKLELRENPSLYLDKNKTYYIYCSYGKNSFKICCYLNTLGYNTINVIGGYNSII